MKNLLTDIAGVRVGHADDAALSSGVTAVIFDKPAVAAIRGIVRNQVRLRNQRREIVLQCIGNVLIARRPDAKAKT
jgi:hypothetical protein